MKPSTRSFYEGAVQRTVSAVLTSLDTALDLEALARHAALSPFHFHRLFSGILGETPLELHRRLRLERAASQLASGEAPVTEIAFSAGYETHEAFTRAFRQHYGASPTEFRGAHATGVSGCARPPQFELRARSGIHFRTAAEDVPRLVVIEGESTMQVTIKTMPEMRVAALRHVGPYQRISETFAKLGDVVGRAHLFDGPPTMLAIFYDDPQVVPAKDLRSDAGLVVGEGVSLPDGLEERRLGAGRYATLTYQGSYEALGDAWARFMGEWLPRSGERAANAPTYEIYRNTPAQVPTEKLLTDLYLPLV
jgi:AraC family transcriptional regulator